MTGTHRPDPDDLMFADELEPEKGPDTPSNPWKLLIVDDEEAVHVMTKMVLADYTFEGEPLAFLSAFSGKEARELIRENPDAACILLDVVMETENAGLDVVQFIRKEIKNTSLRIILRTGQPGKAPEKKVILDYDINDYKEKTELTSQKLFTAVTTAIRSHQHLKDLEKKQKEITDKNIRLNEEIARRIVAESNLAKYNRSLEGMLEDKKHRLEKALQALEKAEQDLNHAQRLYSLEAFSAKAASRMDQPAKTVKANLTTIDCYRQNLTTLLVKYENLLHILNGHARTLAGEDPDNSMDGIRIFRKTIDLETILEHYPEIIKDSRKGIELISRTVSDMKSFIMINSDLKTKVQVNDLLRESLARINPGTLKHIDIQTDLDDLPELYASRPALGRAFDDLVLASFNAVDRQGIISITTQHRDSCIIVSISDTGTGFSSQDLETLFEPYGLKERQDGGGMGLFLAKTVIDLYNGSIEVESAKGQGTTVTITLPLLDNTCQDIFSLQE
ncbi:MAG: ATP-binding protein [Pseudomonadota bacterium]